MKNTIKKGLTVGALSVFAFSLLVIRPAKAVSYGDVVKGSGTTVYFVTNDLKRLEFDSERVFTSWYGDFGSVRTVSDSDLAAMPFAGLAPLRPGVFPVKFASDARVYGIDRGGALRWLSSEAVARMIYGDDWAAKLVILPDATVSDYGYGAAVTGPGQYWWKAERDASPNLQEVFLRKLALHAPTAPLNAGSGVELAVAAPKPAPTRVIIIPTVINDNGGSGKEGDVDYLINGALVMPQEGYNVDPGTYTIYHGEFPGYAVSAWSGDCSADGVVTVPANETRACFITFDDIPDGIYGSKSNRPPTLTLVSYVRNTHGGHVQDQDVKLFIGSMQVVSGFSSTVNPADVTVYRVVPPGYTASDWGGDCTPQGTLALRNGDEKVCTITLHD